MPLPRDTFTDCLYPLRSYFRFILFKIQSFRGKNGNVFQFIRNNLSRFETILNHRYIHIYIHTCIPSRDSLAGSNELANRLRILLFLVSASVMLARHAT